MTRVEHAPGIFRTTTPDELTAWEAYRAHVMRGHADHLEDDPEWRATRDALHADFMKAFG